MNSLITFFIILYCIVCVLLILLVIIQGGKAEGLFASAQANVLGSRGADVLTKLTTALATIFIIGALLISVFIGTTQKSVFEDSASETTEAEVPSTTQEPGVSTNTNTSTNTTTN